MKNKNTGLGIFYFDSIIIKFLLFSIDIFRKTNFQMELQYINIGP